MTAGLMRCIRQRLLPVALAMTATGAAAEAAASCARWPAWEDFRAMFVSQDGRVIDRHSPRRHTVSEGQAYALLFALVADDRASFDVILRWTSNNLAQGDLSHHLPAWQWGRRDQGDWGPLDANPATDADLWIAFVLAEAAQHWNVPEYRTLSHAISAQVLSRSVVDLPGLGPVLLPAPRGFQDAAGHTRLNPAYLPIQVLRALATAHPDQHDRWQALAGSSIEVLRRSAPRGLAPDWVRVDRHGRFGFEHPAAAIGSYDAIRVYLWLGLLHPADPARPALSRHFRRMARLVRVHGGPPERVDARTGRALDDSAPGAFSAAVAPWLEQVDAPLARRQWQRAALQPPGRDEYYGRALVLLAQGWREGRLRFAPNGQLLRSEGSCVAQTG